MEENMKDFFKEFMDETIAMFKSCSKYLKFIFVIFLFLFSSLFQLIPISLFNIDINNMSILTKTYLTIFSSCVAMLIAIIIFHRELKKDLSSLLKMKKDKLLVNLDTSFRYWLIGLIIMLGSNFILNKLGLDMASNDKSVRSMLNASPFLFGMCATIIMPLTEELTFRMGFRSIIKNKWLFVFLSGIVFGSIHVLPNMTNITDLLNLIPYCSMGLSLAVIYADTDNIYFSYFFHIIHNVITAFTAFLLAGVIL